MNELEQIKSKIEEFLQEAKQPAVSTDIIEQLDLIISIARKNVDVERLDKILKGRQEVLQVMQFVTSKNKEFFIEATIEALSEILRRAIHYQDDHD